MGTLAIIQANETESISTYQLISVQYHTVFLTLIQNLFTNAIYWEHRGINRLYQYENI